MPNLASESDDTALHRSRLGVHDVLPLPELHHREHLRVRTGYAYTDNPMQGIQNGPSVTRTGQPFLHQPRQGGVARTPQDIGRLYPTIGMDIYLRWNGFTEEDRHPR